MGEPRGWKNRGVSQGGQDGGSQGNIFQEDPKGGYGRRKCQGGNGRGNILYKCLEEKMLMGSQGGHGGVLSLTN